MIIGEIVLAGIDYWRELNPPGNLRPCLKHVSDSRFNSCVTLPIQRTHYHKVNVFHRLFLLALYEYLLI